MRVHVGADGHVKNVTVVRSVPYLDNAAVHAVRKWVFKPARKAGEPVAAWIEIPVEFHF